MYSNYFNDRVHRYPRVWSNRELERFAEHFDGDVVNVSAWKDIDKEGRFYKDYFVNARSYSITNYKEDLRGFQGVEGEIFLDLMADLDEDLVGRFDVVFNHTTLEHIYDFKKAFENLCLLSRDVVIVVVPFVQQMHSGYGDFWRFSPMATAQLFEEQGIDVGYLSFSSTPNSSVYVFAIGTKQPNRWKDVLPFEFGYTDPEAVLHEAPFAGCRIISEPLVFRFAQWVRNLWNGR